MKKVELEFHGKKITIETGRVARQAHGSALVRCDNTVVLATACHGEIKTGDFLPLTVDYVEKTYAAGKIPGGYFKREGKLAEREILISRLIDRACRPLFPKGFGAELQVLVTVLSVDGTAESDIPAFLAASSALTLSGLPFEGPIAATRVGLIDDKIVLNPTFDQLSKSRMDLVLAGTESAVLMVEGEAKEVPEEQLLDALFYAHDELQPLIALQKELDRKPLISVPSLDRDEELVARVTNYLKPLVKEAIKSPEKKVRGYELAKIKSDAQAEFAGEEEAVIKDAFETVCYDTLRSMVLDEGKRIDGRDFTTVRNIDIEVGFLPRTHGSALFTRGETQAIVATTLGMESEAQRLDNLVGETTKEFMLHYNFPPFSVGEVKPMRGPGRREIGHGNLAERALKAVMPSTKQFPYTVRIVSEITESNGSSSMASVCGGCLSLMDAGVPVKAPVAGIAMGLIKEGNKHAVLTDILGDEDHLGDMDFKVCGTAEGITALQMDIKIKGLNREIMTQALKQALDARLFILGRMVEVLAEPRKEKSKYAPCMETLKIPTDKIRELIGPGGKKIRALCETFGVKIEVNDAGIVTISGTDSEKIEEAKTTIDLMTQQVEVNAVYNGIVVKLADFGAFIEVLPGVSGLLHISQLKVDKVSDAFKEGDEVSVKVTAVDGNRIRLVPA